LLLCVACGDHLLGLQVVGLTRVRGSGADCVGNNSRDSILCLSNCLFVCSILCLGIPLDCILSCAYSNRMNGIAGVLDELMF
jgi:hypothetical protein